MQKVQVGKGWARHYPQTAEEPSVPKPPETLRLAGKALTNRRPPQPAARNHNPKAVGSSPSSGITAALVLFVPSAQRQGMSQESAVPIATLTAMPSRSMV